MYAGRGSAEDWQTESVAGSHYRGLQLCVRWVVGEWMRHFLDLLRQGCPACLYCWDGAQARSPPWTNGTVNSFRTASFPVTVHSSVHYIHTYIHITHWGIFGSYAICRKLRCWAIVLHICVLPADGAAMPDTLVCIVRMQCNATSSPGILHLFSFPECGGIKRLWNVSNKLPVNTASYASGVQSPKQGTICTTVNVSLQRFRQVCRHILCQAHILRDFFNTIERLWPHQYISAMWCQQVDCGGSDIAECPLQLTLWHLTATIVAVPHS
jgi:hypothetical protein